MIQTVTDEQCGKRILYAVVKLQLKALQYFNLDDVIPFFEVFPFTKEDIRRGIKYSQAQDWIHYDFTDDTMELTEKGFKAL